jgi:hypothetical protein
MIGCDFCCKNNVEITGKPNENSGKMQENTIDYPVIKEKSLGYWQ